MRRFDAVTKAACLRMRVARSGSARIACISARSYSGTSTSSPRKVTNQAWRSSVALLRKAAYTVSTATPARCAIWAIVVRPYLLATNRSCAARRIRAWVRLGGPRADVPHRRVLVLQLSGLRVRSDRRRRQRRPGLHRRLRTQPGEGQRRAAQLHAARHPRLPARGRAVAHRPPARRHTAHRWRPDLITRPSGNEAICRSPVTPRVRTCCRLPIRLRDRCAAGPEVDEPCLGGRATGRHHWSLTSGAGSSLNGRKHLTADYGLQATGFLAPATILPVDVSQSVSRRPKRQTFGGEQVADSVTRYRWVRRGVMCAICVGFHLADAVGQD